MNPVNPVNPVNHAKPWVADMVVGLGTVVVRLALHSNELMVL